MNDPNLPAASRRKQRLTLPTITLGKQLGLHSGDGLLVVDVQRDFLPGGTLAVPHGETVIARINAYIGAFSARKLPVLLSRDWHPANHCSFIGQGGRWPAHCVRGTTGAEWPSDLCVPLDARIVSKGADPQREAYSAFSDTSLAALLRDLKIERLFVGGLATDYCVHDTVIEARSLGFDVVVLTDAIRGINAAPDDETRALSEMIERGASLFARAPGVSHHPQKM